MQVTESACSIDEVDRMVKTRCGSEGKAAATRKQNWAMRSACDRYSRPEQLQAIPGRANSNWLRASLACKRKGLRTNSHLAFSSSIPVPGASRFSGEQDRSTLVRSVLEVLLCLSWGCIAVTASAPEDGKLVFITTAFARSQCAIAIPRRTITKYILSHAPRAAKP